MKKGAHSRSFFHVAGYTNLLVYFSGITTFGLKVAASSGVIVAYAMIMTVSPGWNLRAAAPFRQMTPESRFPCIIYVTIRSPLLLFTT